MEITLFPLEKTSSVDPDGLKVKVGSISFGNKVTVHLEGITDRNVVEEMIPFSIWIDRSVLPKLDEDEFYLEDLKGLEVFDHASGKKIGVVTSHYDNGMQTILVINGDNHFELPLVENFFPVIDIEAGRIEINIPQEV